MPLPEVAVSALLLQDRVSNENGPDSGFYYWLCMFGASVVDPLPKRHPPLRMRGEQKQVGCGRLAASASEVYLNENIW